MKRKKLSAVVIQAEWIGSSDDEATRNTKAWAEATIQQLRDSGRFAVTFVRGPDATRQGIIEALTTTVHERGLVVFYGHGCPCGETLLACKMDDDTPAQPALSGGNCGLLQNKIVYAVACHSARFLGPYAVQNGATCYIGFVNKVPSGADTASQDDFRASANAGIAVLIEQEDCSKAYEAMIRSYETSARRWRRQGREGMLTALALYNGFDALSPPIGDSEAILA